VVLIFDGVILALIGLMIARGGRQTWHQEVGRAYGLGGVCAVAAGLATVTGQPWPYRAGGLAGWLLLLAYGLAVNGREWWRVESMQRARKRTDD
jgi:peptidoglycan/LPS O-acetylase OafA/YrhL